MTCIMGGIVGIGLKTILTIGKDVLIIYRGGPIAEKGIKEQTEAFKAIKK